jgi:Fur family ferric uptake transcriptional regulator
MGEVLEVRAAHGPARYDPNVGAPHHHLVCRSCGAIFDIVPTGVEGLTLTDPQQQHGFSVETVDITFRGLCRSCAVPAAD